LRQAAVLGALLALALLIVRRPALDGWRLGSLLRLDALALALLSALLLALALLWSGLTSAPLRAGLVALGLGLAYAAASLPLLIGGFALASLAAAASHGGERWSSAPSGPLRWLWSSLPALCLAAGLGWLGLRAGSWRFGAAELGPALDSICFVFVLLAAALGMGLAPVARLGHAGPTADLLLRPAWLYPLARLYELGPWNHGWLLATALLGGAAALWSGWSAPWSLDRASRVAKIQVAGLAGALAALGLTTEAGLAGALLGVFSAVLVGAGLHTRRRHTLLWLVAAPLPLTLPFVALWLQISAAAAGGLALLGAALWLGAVGWAMAALRTLTEGPGEPPGALLRTLAVLSVVGGVASPLLLRQLVLPALLQLGGAITAYGSVTPWPWTGLEVRGTGGSLVASWLSMAIAGLLLVLLAMVYLLLRLLQLRAEEAPAEEPAMGPTSLWARVRGNLPWLAGKDEPREL
jgi:hypothetical protein